MDLPSYDLHCHSTASDGALAPLELLERARSRDIKILALTDHDTVQGVREIERYSDQEIKIIPGTELTCLWNSRVIHLVGLGFDSGSPELNAYLARINELRVARSQTIAQRMVKLGLPDLYGDAQRLAGNGVVGRPHYARAMVEKGLVANEQQAFKKYLGAGKRGDVKMEWPSIEEAVSVIKRAGGVSVIAHPTKYKMTFTKIRALVADFVSIGGDGIEISYPGATPDHQFHLFRIATENRLMVSAGSDFHTPSNGWTDLGKYPPLKGQENHVLNYLL